MDERRRLNHRTQEIINAFDRERSEAEDLSRRHTDRTRKARARDRQVLIERRRQPRDRDP